MRLPFLSGAAVLLVFFIAAAPAFSGEKTLAIDYYGETGCSHCDTFAAKTVPALEEKYSLQIILRQFDILDPSVYEACSSFLESRGYEFRFFPVVVIGNNIYQGETEISSFLEKEAAFFSAETAYLPERETIKFFRFKGLNSVFLVFAAGAADGINPCAFTVLLFFFSYLTLRRKNYSDFLLAGAVFIFAVFLAYVLIGFGFYLFLSSIFNFSIIKLAVKIVVTLLTAFFAAASLADFFRMKKGKSSSSLLKLPETLNRKIHETVRNRLKGPALAGAVFVTGVAVSFLELACTGQIYLPSIVYMLSSGDMKKGISLLFIYNTGFVLPILLVYAFLAAGIRNSRISAFFRKKMHLSRILLSFVFLSLSLALWLL